MRPRAVNPSQNGAAQGRASGRRSDVAAAQAMSPQNTRLRATSRTTSGASIENRYPLAPTRAFTSQLLMT